MGAWGRPELGDFPETPRLRMLLRELGRPLQGFVALTGLPRATLSLALGCHRSGRWP